MNLNSSPSLYHIDIDQINDDVDHDQHHRASSLGPNHQVVSSSSSFSTSCHFFFSSTEDHTGFYRGQLYEPHHQQDDSYTYHRGSSHEIKSKFESSLKLGLWKKEDQGPAQLQKNNQVKRINSWKNSDRISPKVNISTAKIDVQKLQPSSSFQTDISNNSFSYTVRVCSDCLTTKTPLWRSGPKGPKSLCNACGIRQRKARRAMAAAAAATNGTVVTSDQPRPMKIKVQYKEKMAKNGHPSQFKKHCKMTANAGGSSASIGKKNLGFEDFLINLSNKLALQHVFPEDEKDAAILLMALSSGLLHG